MVHRLVIVARGAPALQAIDAVRDVNAELSPHRRLGTVIVHLAEDRSTRFVRAADRAVELGPVAAQPHRDTAVLRTVLDDIGADAVWVYGWPEAEDAVTEVCQALGISRVDGTVERLAARHRAAVGLSPARAGTAPTLPADLRQLDCLPSAVAAAPRSIRMLELPTGAGIEVTPGVSQGDAICADGRPVLAEIVARATTIDEAVARLSAALSRTTVVADGATTNKTELLDWLADRGPHHGDGEEPDGAISRSRVALVTAAIEAHTRGLAEDVDRFTDTAVRGLPELGADDGRVVHLGLDATTYRVAVLQRTAQVYHLSVQSETGVGTEIEASVDRLDEYRRRLVLGGRSIPVVTSAHDGFELVEVAGHTIRVEHRDGSILRSPIPAIVVVVHVAAGDRAAAGTPLAVLESMKLESVVRAPFDCVVGEWYRRPGSHVAHGVPLVRIEPVVDETPRGGTGTDVLGRVPDGDEFGLLGIDDELTGMLLGYDVEDGITSTRLAAYRTGRRGVPTRGEIDALTAYADLDDLLMRDVPVGTVSAGRTGTPRDAFHRHLRDTGAEPDDEFVHRLDRASSWYGVAQPPPAGVLLRICRAHRRHDATAGPTTVAVLHRWLEEQPPADDTAVAVRGVLDRLCRPSRTAEVRDMARAVRYRWFVQPVRAAERARRLAELRERLTRPGDVVARTEDLISVLAEDPRHPDPRVLELLVRSRHPGVREVRTDTASGRPVVVADGDHTSWLVSAVGSADDTDLHRALLHTVETLPPHDPVTLELYLHGDNTDVVAALDEVHPHRRVERALLVLLRPDGPPVHRCLRPDESEWVDETMHGHHPDDVRRLDLFHLRRREAPAGVELYECTAKDDKTDRRLIAIGASPDTDDVLGVVDDCMAGVRIARASAGATGRVHLWIHVDAAIDREAVTAMLDELEPLIDDPDLEEVLFHDPAGPEAIRITIDPLGRRPVVSTEISLAESLQPFDKAALKARAAGRRGYPTPYQVGAGLAGPDGAFTELDLDDDGALVPVERGPGRNRAGLVVGRVTTPTRVHPEGVTRILLCGDPTHALGAVAEPECARIIAAIDLAERLGVPVEWFALSSGARISMDSGTENMDWVAAALRRIVAFTQAGGELNVVVAGINVGAQPYWNAEATMLMHTRGVLIMTPSSAMVLTGKRSLDFSGGVSADNESGIGGYERVMGPNGQGQYWAPDLAGAANLLMRHYDHTYVHPGEPRPRRASSTDPVDRDISVFPHDVAGCDFRTVGEIFSAEHNPERKKAFDMRTVMHALIDQDSAPLERWADMADAQNAVVMDARLGGQPVCLAGVESRPASRHGVVPSDGPPAYSAGTLYPRSSKKLARAINAASGNRPLVVLANLAGFDGSPDSMRNLQLEYGAEIGRAIVNFDGPIVLCVVGRYHGGAFVVFSKRLNPNLTVLAVAGARASVIGGAPAANVVLSGEARRRARADDRIAALEADLRSISGPERLRIGFDLADLRDDVYGQTLGELAHEFDRVHDVDRAVAVGSVDAVVRPHELRPSIIAAVREALGRRDTSSHRAFARAVGSA